MNSEAKTRTAFLLSLGLVAIAATTLPAAETLSVSFRVPPGMVVEKVAGQPLVHYPLFACFDDRGRLYVAEGTGKNLPGTELVKLNLGRITVLEDTDGDGRFDKSTTFADGLVFPQGVLWHNGAVYVASHPNIWKLTDTEGGLRADKREAFVGTFGFNGNGCDLHGPFLGPDGWLYWTDGRHGYNITSQEGETLEGLAARIWRCRTDGSGLERLAGGPFDNPVELAFTSAGELIGTMDQGPGDCLLHYVEGGVYPREDHPSLQEFIRTGPLLPPITQFSAAFPAALCGLLRLSTDYFGPGHRDTLLTTQFNVHRLQQHELLRDGATFRCTSRDFLVANSYDFHPTDVLEDADGSLIVIDMGAWYNYGCPTSKIAKPEVKGALYRVRREGVPPVKDPWGKTLKLETMTPAALVELLNDARAKVRDRAANQLVKLGPPAVAALSAAVARAGSTLEFRRTALWTLSQLRLPSARAGVRPALANPDASLRSVAAHAAGLERDAEARLALLKMVVDDEPPLRLKAAEALGRIGGAGTVASLLESLRRGGTDRFLEHSLIYALIRIGDQDSTLAALNDANPNVRRAGLIALDQMKSGRLTRELVVPLLNTDDPALQQAALDIISQHADWSKEIVALISQWLSTEALTEGQQASLSGALLAFSNDPAVQQLVGAALEQSTTPPKNRRLLLQVLARCRLEQLPPAWLNAVAKIFQGSDRTLQTEAVAVVRSRKLTNFDSPLRDLASRADAPADLRVTALECIAPRQPALDAEGFKLLTTQLTQATDPLLRVAAGRALGAFHLSAPQLSSVIPHITSGGPLIVPLLIPAYVRCADAPVGLALVAALKKSPGFDALSPDELRKTLMPYPAEVQTAAEPLFAKLAGREREQEAYLVELNNRVLQTPGNPERGRQVFFSQKVGCAGCHRMEGKGGIVGPDLSQVGRFRDPRALLEAVVFPSSTIVPEYRAYTVECRDGDSVDGMIVRETADAIYLRTSQLAEIRVARNNIKELRPSNVSIMPQGLEKTMSGQEFADLLEFLFQRR